MGKKKFPKNLKLPQTANAVQEVVAEAFSASAGPAVPQPHDRLLNVFYWFNHQNILCVHFYMLGHPPMKRFLKFSLHCMFTDMQVFLSYSPLSVLTTVNAT